MLFPTHLVAGYLVSRWWDLPVRYVVAGAALPDLIDKPLAIGGATDRYHSIGHSCVGIGALSILLVEGPRGRAVLAGWVSHLFLDAAQMIINGRPRDVQFFLWPVVKHRPAVQLPPIEFATVYAWTTAFYLEVVIWALFVHMVARQ